MNARQIYHYYVISVVTKKLMKKCSLCDYTNALKNAKNAMTSN